MVTGGCLCGDVRYESTTLPIVARLCWCRLCQYIAAGNAAVSACFRTEHLRVTGDTRDYESVADSGNRMHRRFCPRCGVHLFSEAEARPHLVFVRVGTLDDPSIISPSSAIWTSMAPEWACIDPGMPTFAEQPPPVA